MRKWFYFSSIKAYMKTRTYLEKDDPKFWDKLLNEMPEQGVGDLIVPQDGGPDTRQAVEMFRLDNDSGSSLSGGCEFDV